jgi:diguanylate cyclase (GGDEF)-like protein
MMSVTNGILDFLDRQFGGQTSGWAAAGVSMPLTKDHSSLGRFDPSARIVNRLAFQRVIVQQAINGKPFAVILLDVDGLSRLNETFGFDVGDALLERIGELLRRTVPHVATVAHMFSDEFAILIPAIHACHEAEALGVRIMRAMDTPFVIGEHILPVSVSMGIAHSPNLGDNALDVLPAASRALNDAKAAGGKAWRAYAAPTADASHALGQDLPFAISRNEIVPYYQPIVDLRTELVSGLEVLARWNHPKLGLLLPEQFIKPMEAEGILKGLTSSLLQQVAQDSVKWPDDLVFCFNIAPSQIRELSTYILLQPKPPASTLPPRRIEIEISETSLIDDIDATRHLVDLLQERGARIALDNFGGDRANFRHIRGIPFNRLKVAREFVRDVLHDSRAAICVQSIAAVGRDLGIDATAEGIATQEIANRVRSLGCRYGQGSLYSMPVPACAVRSVIEQLASAADQPEAEPGCELPRLAC